MPSGTSASLIATALTIYAAVVATAALIWQIITWVRSRRPDITVTALMLSRGPFADTENKTSREGVLVTVIPTTNIAITNVFLGRREDVRRFDTEVSVNHWRAGDGEWHEEELGLALPAPIPTISKFQFWIPSREFKWNDLPFQEGRTYVVWIETSSGHRYRSNGVGPTSTASGGTGVIHGNQTMIHRGGIGLAGIRGDCSSGGRTRILCVG